MITGKIKRFLWLIIALALAFGWLAGAVTIFILMNRAICQ